MTRVKEDWCLAQYNDIDRVGKLWVANLIICGILSVCIAKKNISSSRLRI